MIEEIKIYENNYKIFMQETFDTRQSQLKKNLEQIEHNTYSLVLQYQTPCFNGLQFRYLLYLVENTTIKKEKKIQSKELETQGQDYGV